MEVDPLDEYALSTQLLSDGEPVRCCASRPPTGKASGDDDDDAVELLSGSQGGVVTSFALRRNSNGNDDNGGFDMTVQPGGPKTRHPHQITALLSSASIPGGDATTTLPSIYATACKDGIVRILDGTTHELKFTLEGHANAVTSLSWIPGGDDDRSTPPWLASGSWDGTAKVWDVFSSSNGRLLGTLEGHENTVGVAGLSCGPKGVRRIATTSAGIAEGSSIRNHAVRIWDLRPIAGGDGSVMTISSTMTNRVANDHAGPIRDACYDFETDALYTCSNDGTVKVRSGTDGTCIDTLAYPVGGGGGSNGPPMLLSVCLAGGSAGKVVVAGAEDGHVVIWDLSGARREPQVIAHPGCVWNVSPVQGNGTSATGGDFVTSCHDGHVRIFTRNPSALAPASALASFTEAVSSSRAKQSSGPSAEEISKLPKWEMNALQIGRSEGQVQVFNKSGTAIAAQWSEASRTWVEVGEVTGTNANAGSIDGKAYDHVFPIEIDVAGGGVQTLKIGYNTGENPFVTAQAFIDEHMMDQGYLAQIADYIRQRAGADAGPTLGMEGAASGGGGGSAGGGGAAAAPTAMDVSPAVQQPQYNHLPMKGYKTFDAGSDKKILTKVLNKIREFNNSSTTDTTHSLLSESEVGTTLDDLADTLTRTNRYHSSTVSSEQLDVLRKVVATWDAKRCFPAMDLARLAALHPDAARGDRVGYWTEVVRCALERCAEAPEEVAAPMLAMRLVANGCRGGLGSAGGVVANVDRFLDCVEACANSNNKNVRLSIATAMLNVASYLHSHPQSSSSTTTVVRRIIEAAGTVLGSGKYESEAVVRVLVALGTALLIPGDGGEGNVEIKAAATELGVAPMAERMGGMHGDAAKAVAGEIKLILTRL